MHPELNVDLSRLNTLALPGKAAAYQKITTPAQLSAPELAGQKRFILGGGSNLVLTGDFDGLVLHMAIPGRRLVKEDSEAFYVEAGAGENWHDFVQWTVQQGWPGLENLSLIPGTVGAAPIQNIGAYGLEVGECFHSLTAWDFEKQAFFPVDRSNCRFAYRDSVFKQERWHLSGRMAITSVVFRLPKAWTPNLRYADVNQELAAQEIATPTAQDIAKAIVAVRQRKLPDPAIIPNTGSFFHNPVVAAAQAAALAADFPTLPCYPQADGRVKLAAGWLIEQAGWKGKDLGPVGMYEKQALVLVNRGGATGDDVKRTMAAVQADVQARFGVALTPEPIFL
ncbi:MAG: UDP-N-acetylmuramate dehydrogenase [Gammaproteobacteria bacterium]|nr:UDP-N-acetylmuramate dehydrogenase [Gammaproteobacteria bacterium]MBU1600440.1 UDP-N-acetylmuramate dehydrogenase [Gammaproteobacteria bacterium]MBU2434896.1 UDP-N-acetylmuramate dehydrogenase [Gammaproteobacteria bacterium]MBU2448132.1 UDP-N-acetylmuramate dehydrogenase [Gammaproteobacteria bacterium]